MTDWSKYLIMVRKKLWIVILITGVFVSLASYISFYVIQPQYQADAKLFVLINSRNENNRIFYDDLMASQVLVKNYQELITSRSIISEVINRLNLKGITEKELAKRIIVQLIPDSSMLNVSVRYEDANTAADIANEICNEFIQKTSELLKMSNVSLVDKAVVSEKPAYPKPWLIMGFGFLAGINLSLGLILILTYLDDTVGHAEDVEKVTGLNVVGIIPDMKIGATYEQSIH